MTALNLWPRITSVPLGTALVGDINPDTNAATKSFLLSDAIKAATADNQILVAASDSPAGIKAIANHVCDGTADEVQINAAIAALPAGGGVVQLAPGNYVAEGITLKEAVQIRGAGMYSTKISLPVGAVSAMFVAGADASFEGGGIFDVELYGDAGKTQNGLDFSAVTLLMEYFIDRCKISYFAIGIRGAEAGADPMDRFLTVNNTLVWYCTVGMTTYEHPRIVNSDFRNCGDCIQGDLSHAHIEYTKFTYSTNGVVKRSGGGIDFASFMHCSFYFNSGTSLELGRWCTVDSCLFLGNEDDAAAIGINITGSGRHSIVANTFGGSGYQLRGGSVVFSYADAQIYGGSITGNQFFGDDFGSSNTCILAASGCHQIWGLSVVGNTFHLYDPSTGIDLREASRIVESTFAANTFMVLDTGGATYCIRYDDCFAIGNVIANNVFGGPAAASNAVGLEIDARNTVISGNHFRNLGTPITLVNSDANTRIVDNVGYATEKCGTVTVASGTTYVDVTHNLAGTPTAEDVQVTPMNNLGSATKFWISDLGATTFRINVDADPGATTAKFAWRAELY